MTKDSLFSTGSFCRSLGSLIIPVLLNSSPQPNFNPNVLVRTLNEGPNPHPSLWSGVYVVRFTRGLLLNPTSGRYKRRPKESFLTVVDVGGEVGKVISTTSLHSP